MNWRIACGPMFDDEHTEYCPLRSKDEPDDSQPETAKVKGDETLGPTSPSHPQLVSDLRDPERVVPCIGQGRGWLEDSVLVIESEG